MFPSSLRTSLGCCWCTLQDIVEDVFSTHPFPPTPSSRLPISEAYVHTIPPSLPPHCLKSIATIICPHYTPVLHTTHGQSVQQSNVHTTLQHTPVTGASGATLVVVPGSPWLVYITHRVDPCTWSASDIYFVCWDGALCNGNRSDSLYTPEEERRRTCLSHAPWHPSRRTWRPGWRLDHSR